jgi:hypothetical protein
MAVDQRRLTVGELLPILGGAIVGAVALQMPRGRWRWIFVAVGSLVAGALASLVNGELEISAAFVLIDTPLALLGALIVLYVGSRVLVPARDDRST